MQRRNAHGSAGQDDVRREREQFRRVSALALDIVLAPAGIDPHIAAIAPTQLLQNFLERREAGLNIGIVRGAGEHADPPHPLRLLRAHTERPRRRTAEKRDELTSPHIHTQAQEAQHCIGSNESFDRG